MMLRLSWFIKLYGQCLLSSKCAEALNEISDFIEMEGDSLLGRDLHGGRRCGPQEKVLQHWPPIKSLLPKCGIKRMPFSNLETL